MAYIMHYNLKTDAICGNLYVDRDLFLSHSFALSFDNVPERECRLFMFGHKAQDFNSMPTYEGIIQSPIADLIYARKFQILDEFIANTMKKTEKGYIGANTLNNIEGHMTTIMKLRTLNNPTTNPVLIEAYENILKEIENNMGIKFILPK